MTKKSKLIVVAGTLCQRLEFQFDQNNISVIYQKVLAGRMAILLAVSLLVKLGFLTLPPKPPQDSDTAEPGMSSTLFAQHSELLVVSSNQVARP